MPIYFDRGLPSINWEGLEPAVYLMQMMSSDGVQQYAVCHPMVWDYLTREQQERFEVKGMLANVSCFGHHFHVG